MKIRIDKTDRAFSELIRERDNWTCQKCGKTRGSGAKIETSHIFSRRHQATRYDPDNALAMCFSCHHYLQGAPPVHVAFARRVLGEVRFQDLWDRHNDIVKRTKAEKEELHQHLKDELRKLKAARLKGKEHFVVSYD